MASREGYELVQEEELRVVPRLHHLQDSTSHTSFFDSVRETRA